MDNTSTRINERDANKLLCEPHHTHSGISRLLEILS